MKKIVLVMMMMIVCSLFIVNLSFAQPQGAKALFDSGEGTKVGIATGKTTQKPTQEVAQPSETKYAGLRYELFLQKDDGSLQRVSKARVFNTGERIRIQVRTNQSGYLTIRNIGTSGKENVLFSDYVEARQLVEIPRTGAIRFVGAPGTELLEIMLSSDPLYPTDTTKIIASKPQPPTQVPPPSSSYTAPPPPPPPAGPSTYGSSAPLPPPSNPSMPPPPSSSSDIANLPPPPPQALAYNIEGAKSTRPRGAKDLVLVDDMDSKVTVVDRRTWKPSQTGAKDLVVESAGGSNYGVVPVSTLQSGGVLVTEIKLRHK